MAPSQQLSCDGMTQVATTAVKSARVTTLVKDGLSRRLLGCPVEAKESLEEFLSHDVEAQLLGTSSEGAEVAEDSDSSEKQDGPPDSMVTILLDREKARRWRSLHQAASRRLKLVLMVMI